jgi:hypothetical protein
MSQSWQFVRKPSRIRWSPLFSILTATVQRSRHAEISAFGLFFLPSVLPRRFVAAIQAGGRPRSLPWPAAMRSRTMMAYSMASRCSRRSASGASNYPIRTGKLSVRYCRGSGFRLKMRRRPANSKSRRGSGCRIHRTPTHSAHSRKSVNGIGRDYRSLGYGQRVCHIASCTVLHRPQ